MQRVLVPSLDGKVHVPLEIVSDGAHGARTPTILSAYGAYGSVTRPRFSATSLAWLERGGALALAMVRGGGEYGQEWHQAALHATKTLSADDLAACARWLGANGYGDAQHLGIAGGSAGGFLMGLALTRNPSLYRAVASSVGIYDLLRVELTPNGAFNTPEFGTVTDPAQFPWMLAQSPYHNVRKGVAYPAVLMTTGENDPRVDPYNSRKMVAVLQADSSSPYPDPATAEERRRPRHRQQLPADRRLHRRTLRVLLEPARLVTLEPVEKPGHPWACRKILSS